MDKRTLIAENRPGSPIHWTAKVINEPKRITANSREYSRELIPRSSQDLHRKGILLLALDIPLQGLHITHQGMRMPSIPAKVLAG